MEELWVQIALIVVPAILYWLRLKYKIAKESAIGAAMFAVEEAVAKAKAGSPQASGAEIGAMKGAMKFNKALDLAKNHLADNAPLPVKIALRVVGSKSVRNGLGKGLKKALDLAEGLF